MTFQNSINICDASQLRQDHADRERFIAEILGGDVGRLFHWSGDAGGMCRATERDAHLASVYCVADTGRNGARNGANFKALHLIVLDDIGHKGTAPSTLPPPAAIVQTREASEAYPNGSQQWVYRLASPVTDKAEADALMRAVAAAGFGDSSGHNKVRVARLPGSQPSGKEKARLVSLEAGRTIGGLADLGIAPAPEPERVRRTGNGPVGPAMPLWKVEALLALMPLDRTPDWWTRDDWVKAMHAIKAEADKADDFEAYESAFYDWTSGFPEGGAESDVDNFRQTVPHGATGGSLVWLAQRWTGNRETVDAAVRQAKMAEIRQHPPRERPDYSMFLPPVESLEEPDEPAEDDRAPLPPDVVAGVARVRRAVLEAACGAGADDEFVLAVSACLDDEALGAALSAAFWRTSGDKPVQYLTRDGRLHGYAETRGPDAMNEDRPHFAPHLAMPALSDFVSAKTAVHKESGSNATLEVPDAADVVKELRRAWIVAIRDFLERQRQAHRLDWGVDPRATEPRVEFKGNMGRVLLPLPPVPHEEGVPEADAKAVWADYTEALPGAADLPGLIAASWFASDRRQAFVWLHAPSSFGKGMLASALADLGLVVETNVREIEAMLEGKPVGKSPSEFARSAVLLVNEFKAVKSEIKQLEREVQLAPKFQMASTAPLFVKLFLSAESVASLVGADGGTAEDQFINRFAYWTPAEDAKPVSQHESFDRLGASGYRRALSEALGSRIRADVARYLAMEPRAAERAAEKAISGMHRRHGLGNFVQSVTARLPEIAAEFLHWIDESRAYDRDVLRALVEREDGKRVLKGGANLYSHWLAETHDRSEAGTLGRRWLDVAKALSVDGKGIGVRKANGANHKGVLIPAAGSRLRPSYLSVVADEGRTPEDEVPW
ncbi:MAG: hypothetical protein KDK03_10990 [Rhodobacteraceae bacterium]|nr:hypothetical protein [Paracoccaceae bacterium]